MVKMDADVVGNKIPCFRTHFDPAGSQSTIAQFRNDPLNLRDEILYDVVRNSGAGISPSVLEMNVGIRRPVLQGLQAIWLFPAVPTHLAKQPERKRSARGNQIDIDVVPYFAPAQECFAILIPVGRDIEGR